MKITHLDIEGFRSLKKVSWKPGDLNVVIGPNGSGKSNLLRALELINAAAQGRLSKLVQREGGIGALVWDGQASDVDFGISLASLTDSDDSIPISGLKYELQLERQGSSSSYLIKSETLSSKRGGAIYLQRTSYRKAIFGTKASQGVNAEALEEETALSFTASPLLPMSYDKRVRLCQNQLSHWITYHGLRTDRDAITRQSAVSRRESIVSTEGENFLNVLHTLYSSNRDFKYSINSAMNAAYGVDYEELNFPPADDQRVQLRVRWRTLRREQSASEISDGTLHFLFLLTVLANPSSPSLIAIDEPETGLHPSMLPIIAEFAVDAARRTQVIFTTHSDQFLDAFTGTKPTTTVAKWENGETTLTTLSDDELDYWLKDYSLGKLFRSGELEALA